MSIIRAPRPAEKFYVLDKRISEDARLSWAARGLLVYLLGKPDRWEVSVAALVHETKGSAKATRRDGVYGLIRELEKAGYLERRQDRGDGGTFERYDYIVSELPLTDLPLTDLPLTAQPLTVKPTQVNNDLEQVLKSQQVLKKYTRGKRAVVCPQDVSEAVWNDFMAIRKAKRAPMTPTALVGILREANKAHITLEQALEHCCERGWQGFKADWLTPGRTEPRPDQVGTAAEGDW